MVQLRLAPMCYDSTIRRCMSTVFLSYSTKDRFFAELASIKLEQEGIRVWRDRGQLRAGADWRQGIERGISESVAILVVLSSNSAESSYVTYEWAYALCQRKTIIPIRLNECVIHPKLETIQYLDFSTPGALPGSCLPSASGSSKPTAKQLTQALAPKPRLISLRGTTRECKRYLPTRISADIKW